MTLAEQFGYPTILPADWHSLCITDKTGQEFFKCTASPMSTMSEIRNLKRHIKQAKASPKAYAFLDVATAVVMLDGAPYDQPSTLDADALLKELGL
jgi:hypothetical protein